jgi:hypothetical protein
MCGEHVQVRVQAGTKVMSPGGVLVPEFNGPWDCFVKTLRREGFTALYKAPLLSSSTSLHLLFLAC